MMPLRWNHSSACTYCYFHDTTQLVRGQPTFCVPCIHLIMYNSEKSPLIGTKNLLMLNKMQQEEHTAFHAPFKPGDRTHCCYAEGIWLLRTGNIE